MSQEHRQHRRALCRALTTAAELREARLAAHQRGDARAVVYLLALEREASGLVDRERRRCASARVRARVRR
jgi:hypothetical protein